MSQRSEFNGNLRLDRVVASQPELGPSIPDGGYGWIVLIASIFLQILIPSILVSYGIFMLYTRIEGSAMSDEPRLWETALLPTPVVFVAFWTLADPWSRTIVSTSTWPRLVTTAGICLTCAGLLVQWIALRDSLNSFIYMLAGMFSGFGSSLIITQSESLVSQYFRIKLPTANNLLICAYSLGFIIVPITLGFLMFKEGILRTLLIYQAMILQCNIIVLVFKKPKYLKAGRRRYELLQNISEDDEMIFAKDVTENNSRNSSTNGRNETASSSTSNVAPNLQNNATSSNSQEGKKSSLLMESFATDFSKDLDRNLDVEDIPRPLYNDVDITNTNTYTFDNNAITVDDNGAIFLPPPERLPTTSVKQELSFLWKLSFYKSLLFLISVKYSTLVFWILFPTYLYVEMDKLQAQQTTFLVGSLGLGSLFFGLFSSFLPVFGSNRQNVTSAFCFLGAIGYFVLSDAGTEGGFLFSALLLTISTTALQVLYPSVIKYILGIDNERAHTLLHTLVAISVLLLLVHDAMYKNIFRIMALLQLITSITLLSTFLFKSFIKLCRH